MLRHLRIRNLAILEDVEIRFSRGLNLLTGETGAGKSIVVDALGLVLGERAASDRIRTGASSATVEAVFTAPAPESIRGVLEGVDLDDDELVIRRELAEGGSRGFVNGSPVTAGMLRRLAPQLVEVHGQHQHQSLLREESHADLLDGFAGASEVRREVERDHGTLQEALARLQAVRERRGELAERIDLLRFRLQEIDAVDPRPGEDEELRGRREVLSHSAEIAALGAEVRHLLEESEEAAVLSSVARVEERLRQLAGFDPSLGAGLEDVATARSLLEDVAAGLRRGPGEPDHDPAELESLEARLSALAALARKHGGSLDAAVEAGRAARAELERLEADLGDPDLLEAEVAAAGERLGKSAARLSDLRRRRARALQRGVEKELGELAMNGTRFRIALERREDPASPVTVDGKRVRCDGRGVDRIRFLISPNPGEDLRPLARIASGGELSRLMLALEGVLRRGRSAACFVFDEVDAGIGGRVAAVVGEKLQRLARDRQVLCVTHLPQIASRADAHTRIEKKVEGGRTHTRVRPLEGEARVAEIARMLGGARVTRATREHAAEMIERSG